MRLTIDHLADSLIPFGIVLFVGVCVSQAWAAGKTAMFWADTVMESLEMAVGVCGGKAVVFVVLGALITLVAFARGQKRLDLTDKAVLVTGCASGFGLQIAKKLHALGCTVFAGVRIKDSNREGIKQLMDRNSPRMHVLQLDVTSQNDVEAAIDYIKEHSERGLWGVVNNAGVDADGAVEWVPLHQIKGLNVVDLWGLVRVTKGVLPLLRKGKGRVVNMGSPEGRISTAKGSVYCMAKAALDAFNSILRYELEPLGVKCALVEPDNYTEGTNIQQCLQWKKKDMWESMSDEVKSAYGLKSEKQLTTDYMNMIPSNYDLNPVVEAVINALSDAHPLRRYRPMHPLSRFLTFVLFHGPDILRTMMQA